MSEASTFTASVFQNEYLPTGATEVNAVITVEANGTAVAASPDQAVVLLVDTSGSMSEPVAKIRSARAAAAAACERMPDGTWFALIAGTEDAKVVYPTEGSLVRADARTRGEAIEAARRLHPGGGTAMSTWLDLAGQLFQGVPTPICRAYLVTDGENREPAIDLEVAVSRATGVFQCDARGVGADWQVPQLRKVTSALLGELDIIKQPEEMAADFEAFLDRATSKVVADVRLKIWTPKGSTLRFLRQVSPTIEEISGQGKPVDALTKEFPTGAWASDEARDYHLCIEVPPAAVGEERLAARVSLMIGDDAASQGLVRAVWTDDEALSTRINAQVAHYTGQADLAVAIQEGLEARKTGDIATATVKLGKAVQLAAESGNEGTLRLLRKVVDVEDEATGTVKVKRNVEKLDEMELDTRSTRTVQVKKVTS